MGKPTFTTESILHQSDDHVIGFRFSACLIGRLMWKPFDVQFNDLLNEFRENAKLLELELSIASSEEAMAFYTAVENRFRDVEAQRDSQLPEPKNEQGI